MSAVDVLALALLAAVGLSACTLFTASAAERISADPQWRDRLWSAAFWLPVAAPLLTALFLLLPSPKGEPVSVASEAVFQAAETMTTAATPAAAPATSALWIQWTTVAVVALMVAGLLSILRLGQLVLRARRLARVVGRAERAGPEWRALIGRRSCTDLRVSAFAEEAFLAGLRRPVLVLPESLTQAGSGALRAVIDHELAHLRRNDLIALWLEEAARVVLAGNPLMPLLHARRSLAREEACDALALNGADASTRRLYARALIDAFRHRAATPAPGLALTFTGNKGDSAMRRIKAVLDPRPSAGRLTRRLSLAAAVIVGGAVCAGSLALAGQREGERPTVIDMDAGRIGPARNWDLVGASIAPIFETGWPGACGYRMDERDRVFIHRQRCGGYDGADPQVVSLQGIDPVEQPQAAFDAVKAACDAGGQVTISERVETGVVSRAVACAKPAVAPSPKRLWRLTFEYPGVDVQPGDRLHISLLQPGGGDYEMNHVIGLNSVAPDVIQATVEVGYLQLGKTPDLRVNLISKEGVVKAVARPATGPFVQEGGAIIARVVMEPGTATDPTNFESWRETQRLRAEGLSEQQAWEASINPKYRRVSAAQFQSYCAGPESTDGAFCKGMLAGIAMGQPADQRTICAPIDTGRALFDAIDARALPVIAATPPRNDEGAAEYAERTMTAAFPCRA